MSWIGNVPPKRMKVVTEYVDGKLVRESTSVYANGGVTLTELRCTCQWPEARCAFHGKTPEEPPA